MIETLVLILSHTDKYEIFHVIFHHLHQFVEF